MKKRVFAVMAFTFFSASLLAQTAQPVKKNMPVAPVTKMEKQKPVLAPAAKITPPAVTKPAVTPVAKVTKPSAPIVKTNAPGPLKKDGSADMRYKANKAAAPAPVVHLKKDGTKDMRFKENKKHS
ncbi:MAG: hypothetical protein K2X48_13475 [Chitinophagaceae bacterium]|nr:hypothetical protein [Chitinophagaceae bacterium]